jgi:type II restriction enzyme
LTRRIEKPKWILYRHTSNFDIITAVAVNLKFFSKTSISKEAKREQLLELKNLGYYKERNPELPLDSISHRINTLDYYMFGYKGTVGGKARFLFGPLGNLFLKNIKNKIALSKIFLSMLWGIQFPNTFGTDTAFKLYPFRLIFKLLSDKRLEKKLYAFEVAYLVAFVEEVNVEIYEQLVKSILGLRNCSDTEISEKFKKDEHAYVNATYEWDYYVSEFLRGAGVLDKITGRTICYLEHGTNTKRKLTRNYVTLNQNSNALCSRLLEDFPIDERPLLLDDPERLRIDVVKEIHNFFPQALLEEIDQKQPLIKLELLKLPKLIEAYSNNNEGLETDLFEDILEKGFNSFYNVEANRIGGPDNTDIECLYLTKKKKFAVDAKSTKSKLSQLSAGRLARHREKIGAKYTIIVTPRYVPAVLTDIENSPNVILRASTFSEYLYNHFDNDFSEIDYEDFDSVVERSMGRDISNQISDITIEKFASRTKE